MLDEADLLEELTVTSSVMAAEHCVYDQKHEEHRTQRHGGEQL